MHRLIPHLSSAETELPADGDQGVIETWGPQGDGVRGGQNDGEDGR